MLVVWSDDLNHIIPACKDLEDRLIKLLWRTRPAPPAYPHSAPSSIFGGRAGRTGSYYGPSNASSHAGSQSNLREMFVNSSQAGDIELSPRDSRTSSSHHNSSSNGNSPLNEKGTLTPGGTARIGKSGLSKELDDDELENDEEEEDQGGERRGYFGFGSKQSPRHARRKGRKAKKNGANHRPVVLYAPVYNGLAAAMSFC